MIEREGWPPVKEPPSEPKPPERPARRLKRMLIDPGVLMLMLSGTFTVIRDPIPDDAKLVNTYVDEDAQLIALVIESASFEPVPLGWSIPELQGPTFQRREPDCLNT